MPCTAQRLRLIDARVFIQPLIFRSFEIVSMKSGDDVKMNMEDVLSPCRVVVLSNRNSVRDERLFCRLSGSRHRLKNRGGQCVREFVDVWNMQTRKHKTMAAVLALLMQARHNQDVLILVHDEL